MSRQAVQARPTDTGPATGLPTSGLPQGPARGDGVPDAAAPAPPETVAELPDLPFADFEDLQAFLRRGAGRLVAAGDAAYALMSRQLVLVSPPGEAVGHLLAAFSFVWGPVLLVLLGAWHALGWWSLTLFPVSFLGHVLVRPWRFRWTRWPAWWLVLTVVLPGAAASACWFGVAWLAAAGLVTWHYRRAAFHTEQWAAQDERFFVAMFIRGDLLIRCTDGIENKAS